ncbi:MAG TPA: hypothetical protein VJM34_16440 [Novosphingobium sp.]|nr:hypothetical protein [Novosphingobium sp.]
MTPDTALDNLALAVGFQLMGPDARRTLRLALLRSPEVHPPKGSIESLSRLDDLLRGVRPPETLKDRLDLERAERERNGPVFFADFWTLQTGDLVRAGFSEERAADIIDDVRRRVDPAQWSTSDLSMEKPECSEA